MSSEITKPTIRQFRFSFASDRIEGAKCIHQFQKLLRKNHFLTQYNVRPLRECKYVNTRDHPVGNGEFIL